jgi:hypothetical protein
MTLPLSFRAATRVSSCVPREERPSLTTLARPIAQLDILLSISTGYETKRLRLGIWHTRCSGIVVRKHWKNTEPRNKEPQ